MECKTVEHFIGHHIGITARSCQDYFAKELKAHNLGLEQGVVLFVLFDNPNMNISDIAKELRKDKATISREVDSLTKKGFLEKNKPDNDKRALSLSITTSGKAVLNVIKDKMQALESMLYKQFSTDELENCLKVLEFMRNTLKGRI